MEPHEILIYGAIIHDSDPAASEWGFVTLKAVNDKLDAISNDDSNKEILVRINSEGGDVDTGFAIYSALRRKASKGFNIVTRMDGIAASIATVVFLAGDKRIGNEYIDPFVHEAWTSGTGDAEDFKKIADRLEKAGERLAEFYAEHTSLTAEKAREMMDADTSLNAEEIVSLGFATELEELLRPAAIKKITNKYQKLNSKKMTPELEKLEKSQNKLLKLVNSIVDTLKPSNKKTLNNSTGEELVFDSLEENDAIEEGVAALVNDKPAEGEHIIPALNQVIVFEQGKVTEVREHEEEQETEINEETFNALKEENDRLKAEKEATEKNVKNLTKQFSKVKKEIEDLKNLTSEFEIKGQKKDPVYSGENRTAETRTMFNKDK